MLAFLAAPAALADADEFPRPAGLEPAVEFWTTIYTEVPTTGGLIHDRYDLSVVYEKVSFGDHASYRERTRRVRERRDHYRRILRRIARSDRNRLGHEAQRVLALWPKGVSDQRLLKAARSLRFQRGQSDKFRAGLIRSGAWEPHIRRTLRNLGLPEEIAALPHVESSFNPDAYSRAGAAGIWQFTRATGKRYMRVDHLVDERMDPFLSTVAAARLLRDNYASTGNWALAITAYNHGLTGVRRAVREVGSTAITDLIDDYQDRRWGFASRNFYAAFLAAVDVDFHAYKYFGRLRRRPPVSTETVELPFFVGADALAEAFGVRRERLRRLNRGLRGPIWKGDKRVPRGYRLRVPADPERTPDEVLARIDRQERYFAQVPDRYHRVRPGEVLSAIARRYDVTTTELVALNDLRSRNHIRAGQRLRLPLPADNGGGEKGIYTVRRGDTVAQIARRVGMSVEMLAAANGLDDASRIYPGQKLHVNGNPAPGVTTVAETTSDAEAGAETETEPETATSPETEAETAGEAAEPTSGPTIPIPQPVSQSRSPAGGSPLSPDTLAARASRPRTL